MHATPDDRERRRARGRPTAQARAELDAHVLTAAARLFAEVGFHGTSLDAIADGAGVTKRTIYARIGDKLELLRRVVASVHDYDDEQGSLLDACSAVARAVLSEHAVGLHLAALEAASVDATVGEAFYETGPRAARRYLASHLGGDEERAALLFDLLLGDRHRRRLLRLDSAPGEEEILGHVDRVLGALGMR